MSGDKNWVGMGHKECPVCGEKHDEAVLMNQRMRPTLERDNCMGLELCPTHKAEGVGFLTLIACTGDPNSGTAMRTGDSARIKLEAAKRVFNVEPPACGWAFCEPDVIEKLKGMTSSDA